MNFLIYICIGAVNTIVTMVSILLFRFADLGLFCANSLGYAVGVAISFILNSLFTFQVKVSFKRLVKFIIVCGVSYIVNVLVIMSMLNFNHGEFFAQIAGMVVYVFLGYLLNKNWGMK